MNMFNLVKQPVRILLQSKMLTRSQVAAFSASTLKVSHNFAKQQFYVEMNGELATVDYDFIENQIIFLHTEVPEVFRGKGVGKVLAEEAFSYAANNNFNVKIDCEYLQHYLKENKNKFKNLKIH